MERRRRPTLKEVVRECREDGKGWRIDEKGDWYPCAGELGPLPTREEYREMKAKEQEAGS